MPLERIQEMAHLLSDISGDLIDSVIKILREDDSTGEEQQGEMEIDFEKMSPMTISKLDRLLKRVMPEGPKLDTAEQSSEEESSDED